VIPRQDLVTRPTVTDVSRVDIEFAALESGVIMSTSAILRSPTTRVVHIPAECGSLVAELSSPADPFGVIVFARTNAAHRKTQRDQQLADSLHEAGFATLMFDLLTPGEEFVDEPTRALRVDLALLSRRLIEIVDWVADEPGMSDVGIGLFGEGPGAAPAFVTACVRPHRTSAIVAYAERLDAAAPVLSRVHAPSLIIVSGNDEDGLRSNDAAFRRLRCPKQLVRVASDRFTTTGDTDTEVSRLALDWFSRTMAPAPAVIGAGELD
jgi:dienelactone hydrolase